MKLGIISDTHDNFDVISEAVDFFETENCDKVIHCGDMICPAAAELFDADFDFHAVKGNNDGEWKLKETVERFGNWMGNTGELEIDGEKIAVYHGTDEEIADSLTRSEKYSYVFRGHTHRKNVKEKGKTVEINPGGVKLPFQDEKIHVVTLNTENQEFKFHEIT
ncbi:MAG: metallophosphoesterase [Candidatus Nanohalobium sp.]